MDFRRRLRPAAEYAIDYHDSGDNKPEPFSPVVGSNSSSVTDLVPDLDGQLVTL